MDIKTLDRKRGGHKGQLTRIIAILDSHDDGTKAITPEEAAGILNNLNKTDEKVKTINDSIFALCTTDAETTTAVDEAHEIDMKILEISSRLQTIQRSLNPPSSGPSFPHTNVVKLPRIDLPSFDGKYENWQSFQDLFVATVDNNSTLSGAQKLQYLKTCVKGDAAALITSFTVTDTHYREAWGVMTDRYDNKREITNSLIKRFYNQSSSKTESATSLQQLLDVTSECIRSLKVLNRPVDAWDDLIVFIMVEKLDQETRREWAMSLTGTDPPTFKDLQDFLDKHIRGLQASGSKVSSRDNRQIHPQQQSSVRDRRQSSSSHHTSNEQSCPVCKQSHPIFYCQAFQSLSPEERSNKARSISLCCNCLKPGHHAKDCPHRGNCKTCGKRHNTLLHFTSRPSGQQQGSNTTTVNVMHSSQQTPTLTLLKTAMVNILDNNNKFRECRAFLDDGSESCFISEECATTLGLSRERADVHITGLSSSSVAYSKAKVNFKLSSQIYAATLDIEAFIVPRVTAPMPRYPFISTAWKHLDGLSLADPNYHQPGKIDILIGADVMAGIIKSGVKHGPKYSPIAQHTLLGWVLFGKVQATFQQPTSVHVHYSNTDAILQKFWEVEQLPITKHYTPEEQKCEDHFLSTHTRDLSGRFMVKLPFNDKLNSLGESKSQAFRRLLHLERRLTNYPQYKTDYIKFMREYEDLGHMQIVSADMIDSRSFYLPHHFVLKENSTTTKLRVVFDGSAKTTSGISLNSALMTGPTIQDDLLTLLLRFRTHPIALKADIAKMYRQFKIDEADTKYQRILWRESADQPVKAYNLLTVTYGTSSASFLATRCIQQLAKDEASKYPLASQVMLNDMYVDDIMSGASTQSHAIELYKELNQLGSSGGMDIMKWMTSDPGVLQAIPPQHRDTKDDFDMDEDTSVDALGVKWKPSSDVFTFSGYSSHQSQQITKRQLLSELAKVFDPIGFLTPVTLQAKLIFQSLWKDKVDWDDPLTKLLQDKWISYQNQMPILQHLAIPRYISQPNTTTKEIHGFSDASEKAYAAVVYLRSINAYGEIKVSLITSKSRVAPVKTQSLPRLELCGAKLLADLIANVMSSCNLSCSITAWTDSTIVLDWLASYPARWKTFVANRTAKIQEKVPSSSWHHVRSEENPADCASRGISPEELMNLKLWWSGPSWLSSKVIPYSTVTSRNQLIPEEKPNYTFVSHIEIDQSIISKYSSLKLLLRVNAFMLRFIFNCKNPKSKITSELSPSELQSSLLQLIKSIQAVEFSKDIHSLQNFHQINRKSKLKSLSPYLDHMGVLRVGGRLQNADLPEDKKHQIILPSSHHLTWLIINNCHQDHLHGGFQLMYSIISRDYWIVHSRDTIRHFIRKCVVCRRNRAKLAQQLMGSLPSPRVNPGSPFNESGVDYAGPYQVLKTKGRGAKSFKCYFAVFVCFSTKAIHLEAVTDLTSEAFIACFKRFAARRGAPSKMHSDCGTNFVAADKELIKMVQSASFNSEVGHKLADKGTTWIFNSPAAPHQGGLWEAGVKSVKFHLRRVVGNMNLTLEEFGTLLCNVEGILNSRPLCAMSPDPNDLDALTPGHFLIGRPITAIPDHDLTTIKQNKLSRWQQVQQLTQHFWRRWSSEYLMSLQQRFKWTQKRSNLEVGDLVLVHDENLPPTKWKLARIQATHPGKDELVRNVTIKTTTGIYDRPIAKLSPILSISED